MGNTYMNLRAELAKKLKNGEKAQRTILDLVSSSLDDEYYESYSKFITDKFGVDGDIAETARNLAVAGAISKAASDVGEGVEKLVLSYELLTMSKRYAIKKEMHTILDDENMMNAINKLITILEHSLAAIDLRLFDEGPVNFVCEKRQSDDTPESEGSV